MASTLIGHPDRIEPFQHFLRIIAKDKGTVLISGPVGSGKRRTVQFLIENGASSQGPVSFVEGLHFSEEVWNQTLTGLGESGTLVLEGLQRLPLEVQCRFKDWLIGKRPLWAENQTRPREWRVIGTTTETQKTLDELLFQFPLHIQLPSLNEVLEDIPYLKNHLSSMGRQYSGVGTLPGTGHGLLPVHGLIRRVQGG
jgi:DNA-binding NtrC family response regulator